MIRLIFLLLFLALLTSPVWVTVLAVENSPLVRQATELSVDDVANAKRLLKQNDPRRLRDGERRNVVLSQREINLVLNYVLPRGQAARVDLGQDNLVVSASLTLPENPLGGFLNARLELEQDAEVLAPGGLSLGRLHLPGWLVGGLVNLAQSQLESQLPEFEALVDSLESIRVTPGSVAMTYQWRKGLVEDLANRGRELILPREQRQRILDYYARIAELARVRRSSPSLATLLGPLFEMAAARTGEGGDPTQEHRDMLLALGLVMQGANPNQLAGDGVDNVGKVRRLVATLHGRTDLAQHFGISAALAAGAGSELADVVGVFKELSDSQGGSGFSFPDLLADRAGVTLAQEATGDSALRIQRAMAAGPEESLFMPPIDALPEGLQDLEFRSRYEDLDTAAYGEVRQEVEKRLAALPLYR